MDLKKFYFKHIKESEYHYKFKTAIESNTRISDIFGGVEDIKDDEFEIFDAEEAIKSFENYVSRVLMSQEKIKYGSI